MTRRLWVEHLILRILQLGAGVHVIVLTVTPDGATWQVAQMGRTENLSCATEKVLNSR